jgi:hypothetical protein
MTTVNIPLYHHDMVFVGFDKDTLWYRYEWDESTYIEDSPILKKVKWEELTVHIQDLRIIYHEVKKTDVFLADTKVFECHINSIKHHGFNLKQAELIFSHAYDAGHSYGQSEVLLYANKYIDFARELVNLAE